jgi:ABC-type antimicrobial peptide transport system permease subunit
MITPGIANALWPGDDPVGKTIATNYLMDEWLTVVGVVAEASNWAQPKGAQNEIFVPYEQHLHALPGQNQIVAMIRTPGSPDALTTAVRASLHQSLPDSAATFRTMADRIARTASDRRFAMAAVTGFAAIALVLAAVGIYGVIAYASAQRLGEIATRLALGATPGQVFWLLMRRGQWLALAGVCIGLAAAYAVGRAATSLVYGLRASDPFVLAIATFVVVAIAWVATAIPASRASRTDPILALRGD